MTIKRDGILRRVADLSGATVTESDTSLRFENGHAAVFDTPALIRAGGITYVERLAPTAFDEVLRSALLDCRMLFNHDKNLVLARTASGTLQLSVDSRGLVPNADMAPTSYARDLAVLLARGDVDQMSFAFTSSERGEEWDEVTLRGADGGKTVLPRVTIRSVAGLYDVSPVTFPAYAETDCGVRMHASEEALAVAGIVIPTKVGPSKAALRELEMLELSLRGGPRS